MSKSNISDQDLLVIDAMIGGVDKVYIRMFGPKETWSSSNKEVCQRSNIKCYKAVIKGRYKGGKPASFGAKTAFLTILEFWREERRNVGSEFDENKIFIHNSHVQLAIKYVLECFAGGLPKNLQPICQTLLDSDEFYKKQPNKARETGEWGRSINFKKLAEEHELPRYKAEQYVNEIIERAREEKLLDLIVDLTDEEEIKLTP